LNAEKVERILAEIGQTKDWTIPSSYAEELRP
jgi:hypothetical protein